MYVPNGLGPSWFPDWLTRRITRLGLMFFSEASWTKHDEGYARGEPSRWRCDWLFLRAMLRDARLQKSPVKKLSCIPLSLFLWACVRAFGWASYVKSDPETKGEL